MELELGTVAPVSHKYSAHVTHFPDDIKNLGAKLLFISFQFGHYVRGADRSFITSSFAHSVNRISDCNDGGS